MREVRQTEEFSEWMRSLGDPVRARIAARIDRVSLGNLGNLGDVAPIGEGVSELRAHFGPGYRIYFVQRGNVCTLLLGGDKSSQSTDVGKAKRLARDLEYPNDQN